MNSAILQPWLPLHHQGQKKSSSRAATILHSRGLILLPKVPSNILAKVIEYCKRVVTQPSASENDVNLKAFVFALVNDDEETLFGLLVATNYLNINGLFSLSCEDVLDMSEHIHRIFSIMLDFFLRRGRKDAKGNMLTRTDHVVIPNRVVTHPPSGDNDVELKAFILELVNDNKQTLFRLLVATNYLNIKGLLSPTCEDILDMIKCKDS
ncbi:hypothetical protein M9H77_03196 [Catharanthus roseus]|uniref:Uncharacterized protein n=1 Tax=Catharanthus roseus TaxID=4058 RepID=A0ACC0CAG2_CATRO|nr:hypothetical protein M9H77_03196 [Catharanthus roseus]